MKKFAKVLLVLWAIFMVVVICANFFNNTTKVEMVQHGEMEKAYSFNAMIIRNETVIHADKTGVLESMVEDNEMVRKNKHIASIFESKVDGETKAKLANVKMRIEEITKVKQEGTNLVTAGFAIESAIDKKTQELTRALESGDVEKAVSIENDINLLNDRRNVWENGEEYTDEMLDSLIKEREKYENALGNSKQDLYAPTSGIYSTNIDGYEELLSVDTINSMTPDDFESIEKMDITKEDVRKNGYPCKIIDNFTWSVAFVANESEISKLKTGSVVYVRNASTAGDIRGTVSYISAPERGEYVVAVTSNVSCDWAMRDRFLKIDLIKNKYEGLKVPIKALRVLDGQTGVYVVVDGIVKFKKVKVLYKDTGYVIVEENNASTGGLLLYDEIIVSSSKTFKDGEKIS